MNEFCCSTASLYPRDIVSIVKNKEQDNLEESEDISTDLVSPADAASALQLVLRYVEQHAAVTPTDVMFLRSCLNIAASSSFNS
ncbi:hypothetical protein AVEN_223112-1 [Araneus ventricosus]|uniref:Uncharacterized protein n=1 Tax=Araneus ventricosus TaxID=182803 RepID=A0A4Y2EB31_ARAVE|nr:hypothetical protein AVEN_223112-1 [Araneus ventricosus]